jgi:hypothetical protein
MLTERVYDTQAIRNEIRRHFNHPSHTLIIAPRQCGKSTIMGEYYIATDNSAMVCHNLDSARRIRALYRGTGEKNRHIFTASASSPMGRLYDTVFMDELLYYRMPQQTLLAFLPICRKIVAISSPNGLYRAEHPFTVVDICGIISGRKQRPSFEVNHFEGQEELFRV